MNRHISLCVALALFCASSTFAADPPAPEASAVPPISPASQKRYDWTKKALVGGYDRVGKHDPKWDADARQALSLITEVWATPRQHKGLDRQAFELSQKAVEAGCDDPMVLYVYARTFRVRGHNPEKSIALHERAADALADSGYSAFYRALAQCRAAQLKLERYNYFKKTKGVENADDYSAAMARFDKATGLLVDVAKEADLPLTEWVELGDVLDAVAIDKLGKLQVDKALPLFEKSAPKVAYLTVKGRLYTLWAWEARGGGFASTVTREGSKLMDDRLAVAQDALEEAWKLDPTDVDAAIRMLTVELGQGQGRQRMELWFKRATQANPDSLEAYNDKLYYLEPKWYGSPEDMLQFGRDCLKEGRFGTDVPLVLELAHTSLSHYTHGGWQRTADPDYFKQPGVWADLKAVHEGYLKTDTGTDLDYTRNRYAYLATLCGAWDDANKMFAVIGDHPDPGVWTPASFDAARKEAAEKAGT
jgi:hypothetical protein